MKTALYEAPVVRVLQIRAEGIINQSTRSSNSPDNMSIANSDVWGEWE